MKRQIRNSPFHRKDAMKVNVYLHPWYCTLETVAPHSRQLFDYLKRQGAEFQSCLWQGTVHDVPMCPPALVYVQPWAMKDSPSAIARQCAELWHVPWCDDKLLLVNGVYTYRGLLQASTMLLQRIRCGTYRQPKQTVAPALVHIRLEMNQIIDGKKYEGRVTVDGVPFLYQLESKLSPRVIAQALNSGDARRMERARKKLRFILCYDGHELQPVKLSVDLWQFLVEELILSLALELYIEIGQPGQQGLSCLLHASSDAPMKFSKVTVTTRQCPPDLAALVLHYRGK